MGNGAKWPERVELWDRAHISLISTDGPLPISDEPLEVAEYRLVRVRRIRHRVVTEDVDD